MQFASIYWPNVYFYDKQREAIYSAVENDETYIPAGNMLGKDFVLGFIVLYFFLTRHPCRIVTTSAKDDHLRVLWGEIGRYLQSSAYPLDAKRGGPLIVNHQDIKKVVNGQKCPLSYLTSLVASPDSIAAMQGHHIAKTGDGIPRTMFASDESSSVMDDYYKMAVTWANRVVAIGNTWECQNFFRRNIKAGDLPSPTNGHYLRKVIRIRACDSPNVRLAHAQQSAGKIPTGKIIVPGVKDWEEYNRNLVMWDKIQQTVSLNAEFYEGAEILLFPPDWLNHSEELARKLVGTPRKAKAIGIDPAEGGDQTTMAAVDELGVIEIHSKKTPDTNVIIGEAIAFGTKHGVPPSLWMFDRGGGGKQHVDRLWDMGYKARSIGFGETLVLDPKRGLQQLEVRMDMKEAKYAFRNRRAQMYGELSQLIDPTFGPGFAIPQMYSVLRDELSKIPKTYDGEGRLELMPKNRRELDADTQKKKKTLIDLIGHSPDNADAVALAVFGMLHGKRIVQAGAAM